MLATGSRYGKHVNKIELRRHKGYWDKFFDKTDVVCGHVLGFKGL